MTTVKRGRGRPKRAQGPAVDLDMLLDLAATSFATKGYDATSVRELARSAAISHSLAHHYFDTKLDLWKACIDRGFGNMNEAMAGSFQTAVQGKTLEPILRSTIENYVRLSEQFSDYILILLQEAGRGGERFDYIIKNYFQGFIQLARDYYQQTIDANVVRPIPWQTLFTMIFLGGPARYALQPLMMVLSDPAEAVTDPDQHAKDVAELVLRGMLANK